MQQTRPPFPRMAALIGILVLVLLAGATGCEKDDICVDGNTPLLILRFYDNAQPGNPKPVPRLRVLGLGQENPVNTFSDRSELDSIALPLRPGAGETTFILIRDSAGEGGDETGDADTLRFSYQTRDVFISRACGFIAQYGELQAELQAGSANWIQNVGVNNPSVQTQDSAHVSIFH